VNKVRDQIAKAAAAQETKPHEQQEHKAKDKPKKAKMPKKSEPV